MLTTLRIRNLALVTDLTLDLPPGFVAITGETGAGKSIILGALKLLLGERADRDLIRAGSDSCVVEAAFDVRRLAATVPSILDAHGIEPCVDGQLLLKRHLSASGANRQFVNGTPTPLAVLDQLGQWLVDIHGPHDHQSLLHPARQLDILDAFGGLEEPCDALAKGVHERAQFEHQKSSLVVDERTYAQQLDLLRFQLHEITDAHLQPEEETTLQHEHHRAQNAARLLELGQSILSQLGDEDHSALAQSAAAGRSLHELRRLDPDAESLAAAHEQTIAGLRDLLTDLRRYLDRIEVDPDQLRQLEERLNLIQSLRRKYGNSVADVIAFGAHAQRQLEQLEGREAELARINREIERMDIQLAKAASAISRQRQAIIPALAQRVSQQLGDLGFRDCRFNILLQPIAAEDRAPPRPSARGIDAVEFLFAPNPGEPARPLRAIASSGELARVMLALKTVLAAQDAIPVLVFDEVDANVGGETANAVGEKMRQIAARRQVLCITHLAPVAAAADSHFLVTKEVRDGRTLSLIRPLDPEPRVDELARMLGGHHEAARRHAAALLAHRSHSQSRSRP